MHLSLCQTIYLIYLIHPSIHPFIRLSVRLSVRPSVCLSVRPSVRPPARPPVCHSVRPPVSVRPPIHHSSIHPSHPSIHSFISLVYLICLSIYSTYPMQSMNPHPQNYLSSLLSPFLPDTNNITVVPTTILNWRLLYSLLSVFIRILWCVIKNYGKCCCRVRSNERQGSSIRETARRTLVTVCDKFQLVRCSQSVVSYGWEKVCFKVCRKSWITNNALTWNFVWKNAKETRNVKISLWWCCSDHEDGLQVVRAIS